jgi:hypothetical protein
MYLCLSVVDGSYVCMCVCVCVCVGGPAVNYKLKKKVTCKLECGLMVMCDGGQLACKSVIHVQYPPAQLTTTYNDYLSRDEKETLKCCVVNILATCKEPKYQFNTIAIPVIGSYSNKEKLKDCMWQMATALRECVEVIKSLSVRHIVLVANGKDNFKLFRHLLGLVFATDTAINFNAVDIDKYFTVKNCFVSLMTGDLLTIKVGYFTGVVRRSYLSVTTVLSAGLLLYCVR